MRMTDFSHSIDLILIVCSLQMLTLVFKSVLQQLAFPVPGKTGLSCKSLLYEPPHDKTNKMTCAPIKDSDQSGQ